MPKFEMLTPAKEAELKENLWKIAKFEKAIKKVSVSAGTLVCRAGFLSPALSDAPVDWSIDG